MIKLSNIKKDYNLGTIKVNALRGVDLELASSGFVCVHGPSGCGKTTLLNLIGGLDKPTSGNLYVNGEDTNTFTNSNWDSYRNQEVGFIFQEYYLLPQLSVFENVELSLELIDISREERKLRVTKALESVDLLDQAKKRPNQLSGGQIQRVAIARAIVNDASIILADEPTGALDSKNAEIIMNILKDISKTRLVILVSHNLELSEKYADRVIEMLDGKIVNDTGLPKLKKEKLQQPKQKTSMNFFTNLKISIRNLFRTKLRTPLIIFAGSIGMIGIGLVLSIAKGVNIYIEEVQKSALVNYPIYINSTAKVVDNEGEKKEPLVRFPDTEEVYITRGETKRDFYNVIDKDFIDYLDQMNPNLYSLINYRRKIKLRLISFNEAANSYSTVQDSYFYEMTEDLNYMENNYDKLYGEFPENSNELALLVNNDNSIAASIIDSLKIYFDIEEDSISFADIVSTEYKLISNNDFFYLDNDRYRQSSNREYLYNNSEVKLRITAIIRAKEGSGGSIYSPGILYSKELTDFVYDDNLQSDIVIAQLDNGLTKDVMNGQPFTEQVTSSTTYSKEYLYEERLIDLGVIPLITTIYIYTNMFADRLVIKDYVEAYVDDDATINLRFNDNMNNITNEFSELVRVFSTVLIIFSSISLVVSSIMIGVITYISVIQRTKEIGLLRSIGARKKDIARMFNTETTLIGSASGLLGIIGVLILLKPVNNYVQTMVSKYTYQFRGVEGLIVAKFEPIYALVLFLGSVVLSLLSGIIPAIVASLKSPIKALRNER